MVKEIGNNREEDDLSSTSPTHSRNHEDTQENLRNGSSISSQILQAKLLPLLSYYPKTKGSKCNHPSSRRPITLLHDQIQV